MSTPQPDPNESQDLTADQDAVQNNLDRQRAAAGTAADQAQDSSSAGANSQERDAADMPMDDERRAREQIAETGEPPTDALGNQDGAS